MPIQKPTLTKSMFESLVYHYVEDSIHSVIKSRQSNEIEECIEICELSISKDELLRIAPCDPDKLRPHFQSFIEDFLNDICNITHEDPCDKLSENQDYLNITWGEPL